VFLNFDVPITLEDSSFTNVGITAPFISYTLSSETTCVQIFSKPDEVIKLQGVTFQNVKANSVPAGISVSKSSLTGTAISGYNILLNSITLTGTTIVQPTIVIDSADAKVQFDTFKFKSNTISGAYPSIKVISVGE